MFDVVCRTTECWSATGDMMAGWGALAAAAAVIYAANRASNTFRAYRRQKQEDRRIDAAERILTLAYSLKRILTAVRSPMSMGGEIHEAQAQLEEAAWYQGMNDAQKSKARIGQVALRRVQQHKDDWDKITEMMPMARALFGEDTEANLQTFWAQVVAVNVSAEMYRDDNGNDPEFTARMERAFWSMGVDRDEIAAHVDEAISGLEAELLPIIRAE